MKKKEMDDIADSLHLKKCFNGAVPLPGISRFHCIQPQGDGSVQCRLYSQQGLVQSKISPDVYPYYSDESDTNIIQISQKCVKMMQLKRVQHQLRMMTAVRYCRTGRQKLHRL